MEIHVASNPSSTGDISLAESRILGNVMAKCFIESCESLITSVQTLDLDMMALERKETWECNQYCSSFIG